MENISKGFDTLIAVLATAATYLFGGWDTALMVLVVFMILDFITGIIKGIKKNKIDSELCFLGLKKKGTIIIILIMGTLLDYLIGNNAWVFRTLVCYFYIANEGISIIENISLLGLPVPSKLKAVLLQIKNESEAE